MSELHLLITFYPCLLNWRWRLGNDSTSLLFWEKGVMSEIILIPFLTSVTKYVWPHNLDDSWTPGLGNDMRSVQGWICSGQGSLGTAYFWMCLFLHFIYFIQLKARLILALRLAVAHWNCLWKWLHLLVFLTTPVSEPNSGSPLSHTPAEAGLCLAMLWHAWGTHSSLCLRHKGDAFDSLHPSPPHIGVGDKHIIHSFIRDKWSTAFNLLTSPEI